MSASTKGKRMFVKSRIVVVAVKLIVIIPALIVNYLLAGILLRELVDNGALRYRSNGIFADWPELAWISMFFNIAGPLALTFLFVRWLLKFYYFRRIHAILRIVTHRAQVYEIKTPHGEITVTGTEPEYKVNLARSGSIKYGGTWHNLDVWYLDRRHFWQSGYKPGGWLRDEFISMWNSQFGDMRRLLKALRWAELASP